MSLGTASQDTTCRQIAVAVVCEYSFIYRGGGQPRQASADSCFQCLERKLREKARQVGPVRGSSSLHAPLPCLSALAPDVPSSWKGFSMVLCREKGLLRGSQASTCCFVGRALSSREKAVASKRVPGACVSLTHTTWFMKKCIV